MSSPLGIKILHVEDDRSIRETISDLLVLEGYEVSSAESAEEGLRLLKAQRFDLLLTDYALPGMTGTQMVSAARERGLLQGAPVLVITAHANLDNPERLEVLKKPLDVDQFLHRIAELVAPVRGKLVDVTRDWLASHSARSGDGGDRLELVLYISAYSPSSLKALRNAQRLLQRYGKGDVRFTVRDLSKEPCEEAEADKIAFTPTLVKRKPAPRTWILGDLENTQVLEDLLSRSGAELSK